MVKARYSVADVARYILFSSQTREKGSTNARLQKMLYFIDGYYLVASRGKFDLFGEDFQSWESGPVVEEAYKLFFSCADDVIPEGMYMNVERAEYEEKSKGVVLRPYPWKPDVIEETDRKFIDSMVGYLVRWSDDRLVTASKKEGAPWMKYHLNGGHCVIPKGAVRYRCQM